MPWTPEGIYVDDYGQPAYPGDEAYGAPALAGGTVTPPYVPPAAQPAASPVLGADPLPVPAVEEAPAQPYVPSAPPPPPAQGGTTGDGAYSTGKSQSYGQSVSYSHQGTPAKDRAEFANGTAGDQAYYQHLAEVEAANLNAPVEAAYNERIAATASPEELAGAPTLLKAQTDRFNAVADQNSRVAKMYRDFAVEEKVAHEAGQAVIQTASANYQAQVAKFQAMQVNPGQLWGNMTGGQRAGTFASVFIHDFLGARGIKTSTMDTINMAIDRNISAQIANINKEGQVAGMFKDLYTMAVNESASDEEARNKMRGFYVAQMEKDVASELARYDAPLAQAKAAEAIAMLKAEKSAIFQQNYIHATNRADRLLGEAGQNRRANLAAAVQREQIAASERMAEADREANKPAADPLAIPKEVQEIIVRDPSTGDIIGIDTGGPVQAKETRMAIEGITQAQEIAAEFKKYSRRGKIYNGPGGEISQDQYEKAMRTMRKRWVAARVLAISGRAATDNERKDIGEQLPLDAWVQDAQRTINDTLQVDHAHMQAIKKSRLADPSGYMSPEQLKKARGVALGSAKSEALSQEANDENSGKSNVVEDDIDKAFGRAAESASNATYKSSGITDITDAINTRTDRKMASATPEFDAQVDSLWVDAGLDTEAPVPKQWAADMLEVVQTVLSEGNPDRIAKVKAKLGTFLDAKSQSYDETGARNYINPEGNPDFTERSAVATVLLSRMP